MRDFTIPSGQQRTVVPFVVMDPDTTGERGESFELCITISPSSTSVETLAPDCVTVTLIDDDGES